ncbi:MAG: tyrosine-type recombinase/integrase [Patescibacteria group bacterium]|nr:tyrosine-type recombinase/integrase [Patescibacteria group bacterium]
MSAIRRRDRADEWWVDFRFQGQRIRKRSPVQTRRGAEQYERCLRNDFVADVEAGRDPFAGPPPTLAEFAELWMREYSTPRNRETTVVAKRYLLDQHILRHVGQRRIDVIDSQTVDDLVAALRRSGLAPKSINNALSVLHTCLRSAARWHVIRHVPEFQWARVPEPRFRYLSKDEERALIGACRPGFWRALIVLLLQTGLRFSEAAALEWSDIDHGRATPTIRVCKGGSRGKPGPTKTGSHREVPLSPAVSSELATLARTGDLIFPTPKGRMMDPAVTGNYLHRICARAGIAPCGWHVLRHTFATRMASANIPLPVLQKLLGHTTLKMTMRYVHVDKASMSAAVETIEQVFESPRNARRESA